VLLSAQKYAAAIVLQHNEIFGNARFEFVHIKQRGAKVADIHIERAHAVGLERARNIARQWAEQAQQDFSVQSSYEEGEAVDTVSFSRAGISGTLQVDKDSFNLDAELGFLFASFKERIETQIAKNLDDLLAANKPGK
jgi:putative polyhydroxyalkanoate system protein